MSDIRTQAEAAYRQWWAASGLAITGNMLAYVAGYQQGYRDATEALTNMEEGSLTAVNLMDTESPRAALTAGGGGIPSVGDETHG